MSDDSRFLSFLLSFNEIANWLTTSILICTWWIFDVIDYVSIPFNNIKFYENKNLNQFITN